jgi:MYXO-CTERM domain-containing protein
LRLHCCTIDTELDPSCQQNSCDNIYLYNAAGDLYQILSGTHSDVTSLQIPGDTVRIRLVADYFVTKFGYIVDRIDLMGEPALPPDGGAGGSGGNADAGGSGGAPEAAAGNSSMAGASNPEGGTPPIAPAGGAGGTPGSAGTSAVATDGGAPTESTPAMMGDGGNAVGGASQGGAADLGEAGAPAKPLTHSKNDGGCGCIAVGSSRAPVSGAWLMLGIGLLARRRQRHNL